MPIIQDEEFGKITVRRSAKSTQVRLRVAPDGTLRASLPVYAPMFLVKRLIKTSRDELRKMLSQTQPQTEYTDGARIGKSHTLVIRRNGTRQASISRHGQQIIATLPEGIDINDERLSKRLREVVIAALRVEAKSYLPKRLDFLSKKLELNYSKVRFSHASSRWGSCSSTGTISLNIALMKLPFELIDYVIVHELAHTIEMNHSPDFWDIVATADPLYKQHRAAIKQENPMI